MDGSTECFGMESSMEDFNTVQMNIQKYAVEGKIIPHSCSYPVIRKENDGFVIAAFVQLKNHDETVKKLCRRPEFWITLDIGSGELLNRFACKDKEFSKAPYGRLYDIGKPEKEMEEDDYQKLMSKLDLVRSHYVEHQILDGAAYLDYFHTLLNYVPSGLCNFYKELGRLH